MSTPVNPPGQKVARQALEEALGIPVSTRLPREPAEKFVVISRIGDSASSYATFTPRFIVECYAPGEEQAEELVELVRHTWIRLRSHGINSGRDDNNVQRLDNPDIAGHARFQFTGGLTVRLSHYA